MFVCSRIFIFLSSTVYGFLCIVYTFCLTASESSSFLANISAILLLRRSSTKLFIISKGNLRLIWSIYIHYFNSSKLNTPRADLQKSVLIQKLYRANIHLEKKFRTLFEMCIFEVWCFITSLSLTIKL